ncbi:MAG: aminotransferase class V-fold PLP-dependent enzyme [Geobacteraceae bacterium]|nr:aminotransferase class V-fold PLP-dependent enzyme [Geobacteraceae bacterium]
MSYERLTFKVASEAHEFEQIHRLNYRTFVEEIPQHPANDEKLLVDRFHHENSYYICMDGDRLTGMLAMRSKRPFSLDSKVAGLDSFLPSGACACEFRLLAVEPEYRKPGLFAGLLRFAAAEATDRGYNLAVASGTLRQTRLYSRMGFVPFASAVGTADASFQPMYLSLETARKMLARIGSPEAVPAAKVSFMPGPVEISRSVQRAFARPPISHRSAQFLQMTKDLKERLLALTGAQFVELLLGSGTLGNDVVAAQLKLLSGRGLLLSNGEFGDRLVDHAGRMGLEFELLSGRWGEPFDMGRVEAVLATKPEISWLWTVHCETSSGILNDIAMLGKICEKHQVRLCLDCTSSLGTLDLDLRQIYLASSVSGKGLASFPGIALVFSDYEAKADSRLPRYLDLGYYRQKDGTPFTHSSNLVAALQQALVELRPSERFDRIKQASKGLRRQLAKCGFELLTDEKHSSPAVITVKLSPKISSLQFGETMESYGWHLSYRSSYLLERNLVQICLMGGVTEEQCAAMAADFETVADEVLNITVMQKRGNYVS